MSFDDKIVAMYAHGMTVREIRGFLIEQYGTEVTPEFFSPVTDGLRGTPEALESVFSAITLQACIAHLIHNSLDYAEAMNKFAILYAGRFTDARD